jgi:ATP-dependent protease ClpP protease subunit
VTNRLAIVILGLLCCWPCSSYADDCDNSNYWNKARSVIDYHIAATKQIDSDNYTDALATIDVALEQWRSMSSLSGICGQDARQMYLAALDIKLKIFYRTEKDHDLIPKISELLTSCEFCYPAAKAERLSHLGDFLSKANRHAEALGAYQQAADLTPRNPRLSLIIALELELLRRPAEAQSFYKKTIELAGSSEFFRDFAQTAREGLARLSGSRKSAAASTKASKPTDAGTRYGVPPCDVGAFCIRLSGDIDQSMVDKVRDALNSGSHKRVVVVIDSPGGSVASALDIGHMLRDAQAAVWVERSASCASACTLIYAAGVLRTAVGKIGIHRPSLAEMPRRTDMKSVKEIADHIAAVLRTYAAEMNVSERFVDDMLVVPPEKIWWLSQGELDVYGLGRTDPVYAESIALKVAKQYEISPIEYRRRELHASQCRSVTMDEFYGYLDGDRSDCAKAILSGRR